MRYIHATSRNRRSGTTMQRHKARGSESRWHLAREVLPGFPVTRKFESESEAEEYVSGAEITCLLCGKPYKSLAMHIRVHGIDADHYREMYDIPSRVGLDCSLTKNLRKETSIFTKEPGRFAWRPGVDRTRKKPIHIPSYTKAAMNEKLAAQASAANKIRTDAVTQGHPEKREEFLRLLRDGYRIGEALKRAAIDRKTYKKWRREISGFLESVAALDDASAAITYKMSRESVRALTTSEQ